MRANGADQRKLLSFPKGAFGSPVWSPDGHWIAYLRFRQEGFTNENSIEILNLEKGITRVLFSDPHLDFGLRWLPEERLLYALDEPPPNQNNSNFFATGIDLGAGRFKGKSSRITDGDGFVAQPSVTTDSTRLVFNRTKAQLDVYVSEFSAKGPRLSTPRRLTLDDADDLPFDWTPDNKSVLFVSNRTGTLNIFRQRIDEASTEMLALGPEQKIVSRLSPDGSQILYVAFKNDNSQPTRLMRAPINGGPPQVLVEIPQINNQECSRAPATICAFSREEPQEFVISIFDPANGTSHEVVKRPQSAVGWNWGLSPDGTSFALVTFGPRDNRIQLVSISGQPTREITVKNWSGFMSADWASDSKGLFVTSNPTGWSSSLLYVDLAGNAHELWRVKSATQIWAIPSHNGKYVAIPAPTIGSNAWMADNF
jgi:Tol biopolymer transport system component